LAWVIEGQTAPPQLIASIALILETFIQERLSSRLRY
jgi:hypothetical protein